MTSLKSCIGTTYFWAQSPLLVTKLSVKYRGFKNQVKYLTNAGRLADVDCEVRFRPGHILLATEVCRRWHEARSYLLMSILSATPA